jgi:hypothetical protein
MIILIDALSYAAIPTANWIAVPAIAVAVWAIAQSCVILSRRGPSVLRQIAFGGARRG